MNVTFKVFALFQKCFCDKPKKQHTLRFKLKNLFIAQLHC